MNRMTLCVPVHACITRHFRRLHSTSSQLFSTNQSFHLDDAGPMASLLRSRAVVRFSGSDTIRFLQGLLTNDVRRFGEQMGEKTSILVTPNMPIVSAPPMYAALLSPQGRFLFDMFVYRPPRPYEKLNKSGSGPGPDDNRSFELLMDVDRSTLDEFLDTFKKYRLRANVEIENVSDEFLCWQRFGQSLSQRSPSADEPDAEAIGWGGGVDESSISSSKGNSHGWQWFRDPRLDCLGFRGVFPSDIIPPLVEADKETDEGNYVLWRFDKGVAEGSSELPKGEAIPLEYNLAGLNAISFNKGCYVGQELVARTHHRGVIRKRLVPLQFLDGTGKDIELEFASGSEVIDATSRKKAGNVTATIRSRGLGLLRLEDACKGSATLTLGGHEDVKVRMTVPKWWPPEWSS